MGWNPSEEYNKAGTPNFGAMPGQAGAHVAGLGKNPNVQAGNNAFFGPAVAGEPTVQGVGAAYGTYNWAKDKNFQKGDIFGTGSGGGGGGGGGGGSDDFVGPQLVGSQLGADNQNYMNKLKGMAMVDPQSSPWMAHQMQQEGLRYDQGLGELGTQGASNLATQQGQMAMRGGLTSGATERLGTQNLQGQLMGQQNLSMDRAGREAGIRSAADERQRALMGQYGGELAGQAQYKSDLDMWNAEQINADNAAKYASGSGGTKGGTKRVGPLKV